MRLSYVFVVYGRTYWYKAPPYAWNSTACYGVSDFFSRLDSGNGDIQHPEAIQR